MRNDWLFKFVPVFIVVVFTIIVACWIAMGVGTYMVISNPKTVAHEIGEVAGSFRDGFNGK